MPRLTLLLPPAARLGGQALPPGVARALGRGDLGRAEAGHAAQLARHFHASPGALAEAALTRAADTDPADARDGAWLRADPAHVRPDINGARLLGIGGQLQPSQADVDALLPALQPLFAEHGLHLDAPHPARWYLRLPTGTVVPAFAAPDDALGDDLFEHIPGGAEARRWRLLASEAQVTLHNHPRNAARIAAGLPAINALWFWGGGTDAPAVLPDAIASASPTLCSDDVLLHGIARIAKVEAMALSRCDPATATDALVDLRGERDPARLVGTWLASAVARLPACDLVLDFADGHVIHLRHGQRWRVWRRPLAALPT